MVRVAGLEPARAYAQQILSLWCLPIPPYPHIKLFELAAALGVEPRPEDLESSALPLRHTASFSILRERFFLTALLTFYIYYIIIFLKNQLLYPTGSNIGAYFLT